MAKGLEMNIQWHTRACTVNGEYGYFHTWEQYSKPLPASNVVGGAPAGVFSTVYGIVEFANGVRRVDPTYIHFCDEENAWLKSESEFWKKIEEETNEHNRSHKEGD